MEQNNLNRNKMLWEGGVKKLCRGRVYANNYNGCYSRYFASYFYN